MYRTVFDREIGTPPPSSVDVDGVIRRRRRARRLRTALVGAVAGVTAVALVGVTVTAADDDRRGERVGGPLASPPVPDVPARLEAALRGFLNATLPGAEYQGNRPQFGPLVFEHRYHEAKAEVPGVSGGVQGEDYYYATADITTDAGTGNLSIGVGRRDPDKFDVRATCPEDGPLDATTYSCLPSTGPGDTRTIFEKTTGSKAVQYRAVAARADGITVFVVVTNNSRKGAKSELELDRADSPAPPLNGLQARDLALLSGLTV
ncbi:hypothetical protein GCM10009557_55920 [Virgisporangium ochraceum]|uniref:Uncharacterized protein n=1 Tax=Virgisporangium ochraceum TaxID=65505 RepID=A0A8J3ZV58_9ACTN|nr:hypothetical protein [Virgisporangium ochraceum]GIJ69045.1 hypothetical protein Voc01_039620 [Virgisporangium ochraceum]